MLSDDEIFHKNIQDSIIESNISDMVHGFINEPIHYDEISQLKMKLQAQLDEAKKQTHLLEKERSQFKKNQMKLVQQEQLLQEQLIRIEKEKEEKEEKEINQLMEEQNKLGRGYTDYMRNTMFPPAGRAPLDKIAIHETIIYMHSYIDDTLSCHLRLPDFVITNKNVYLINYPNQLHPKMITPSSDTRNQYANFLNENYFISSVYSFHNTLTLKNIQLILQIYDKPIYSKLYTIEERISCYKNCREIEQTPDLKRGQFTSHYNISTLEAIICLIPGSYKNSDWKQLNGFFGPYYNSKTNQLLTHPPSISI
jgi:hypothetical protein